MIRLPDVNPARPAKPTPASRYQPDAEWSGPTGLGREAMLRDLALRRGWNLVDEDLAEHRFAAWMHEEDARFDEELAALSPAEAKGFADRNTRDFFERAKVFKASLPERARPAIDDAIAAYEQGLFAKAAAAEDRAQVSAVRENLDVSLEATVIPAARAVAALPAGDPEKFDRFVKLKAKRFERIDRNPALSPHDKQQRKAAEAKAIDTAFAEALSPEEKQDLDPEAAIETVGDRIRRYATERQGVAGGGALDEGLADSARFLTAQDHIATPGPLYLASAASPETALRLLQAAPDSPAADVDPAAASERSDLFYVDGDEAKPRTAGEVIAHAEEAMAGTRLVDWRQQLSGASPEMQAAFAADGRDAAARAAAEAKLAQADTNRRRLEDLERGIEDGTRHYADVEKAVAEGWVTGEDAQRLYDRLKSRSISIELPLAPQAVEEAGTEEKDGEGLLAHVIGEFQSEYHRKREHLNGRSIADVVGAAGTFRAEMVRGSIAGVLGQEALNEFDRFTANLNSHLNEFRAGYRKSLEEANLSELEIDNRIASFDAGLFALSAFMAIGRVGTPKGGHRGEEGDSDLEYSRKGEDGLLVPVETRIYNGIEYHLYRIRTNEPRSNDAPKGTPEYEILNNAPANAILELDNGKTYRTNSFGDVERTDYIPVVNARGRNSMQTKIGRMGRGADHEGGRDVGGHAIKRTHGGSSDAVNIFMQNEHFNNSAYKIWENWLDRNLENIERVGIDFIYQNLDDRRPDSLEIDFVFNGSLHRVEFPNEHGD